MLKKATAITYYGGVSTGKTRPCRIEAIDETTNKPVELILKCSQSCESGSQALTREVLGAHLARLLGLNVPDFFVVTIPDEFVAVVTDQDRKAALQASCNKAFGSQIIPSANVMPTNRPKLGDDRLAEAAAVWAFDGACENCDRRVVNPNLLTTGSKWWLIDHELIWPTVYLFGHRSVWTSGGLDSLAKNGAHVFTSDLKGKEVSLTEIGKRWAAIDLTAFTKFANLLPQEWGNADVIAAAVQQISNIQNNLEDFLKEAKRVLI